MFLFSIGKNKNQKQISSQKRDRVFCKGHTPPRRKLEVLQKLKDTYKLWHEFVKNFPKTSRYTLGAKIDFLFIETTEYIVQASFKNKEDKLSLVLKASAKLDLLKFFLQISWEIKALDNKKYILLSEKLNEVGRMLGGWQKHLRKLPSNMTEERR